MDAKDDGVSVLCVQRQRSLLGLSDSPQKALLSIVTVFAYKLGGNLRGLLDFTVPVSSLFLRMQTNLLEGELRELNTYKNVALLASWFTIEYGLMLNTRGLPIRSSGKACL